MKIKIERLTDNHRCETCGSSYADGANITLFNCDGDIITEYELEPFAHCYNAHSYTDEEIFTKALEMVAETNNKSIKVEIS